MISELRCAATAKASLTNIPEEYRFTYSDTTDAEAEQVLRYLAESYSELLGFDEPETVSYGDYTFDGVFNRSYLVYDTAGDDTEDILNYNFRTVSFAPNDAGNLYLIRTGDGLHPNPAANVPV